MSPGIPEQLGATARTIRMSRCDGRDQVVAALQRGWTEFEPPMPDAFVALVRTYGIKELVRTGAVVMARGSGSIEEAIKR